MVTLAFWILVSALVLSLMGNAYQYGNNFDLENAKKHLEETNERLRETINLIKRTKK